MTSLDHGLAPKMKPVSPRRSAVVCGLDIGTSKVACMIARLTPRSPQEVLHRRSHAVEVLGLGHAQARGMKAGTVVDLVEAEAAVRQAVDAAERMAGVHIESVVLAVSAGRMASELYAATVHLRGSTANEADIERVLAAGSRHSVRDGRAVLHSLPIGYAL
ncbi:MAG TPA: cell division protein FtsA, partial [Xanthobacteraceae bacterium]|nr:cell division protein FtsA [Xanthobacteraceae bacterium]